MTSIFTCVCNIIENSCFQCSSLLDPTSVEDYVADINEDYEEEDEDDEYCAASRKQDDVEEDPIEGRYHSLSPDIFIEILFLE